MKKIVLFIVTLLALFNTVDAERKKVGIVLSGGGAKGVAHIGVLKVLEEAGIPIDYIAGTSMGAIVGGLYAVGYDSHRLDSLVRKQDWMFLLSDKVYRYNLPFSEKDMNEKFLISFPFSPDKKLKVPAGFISGQNIYNLFSELTIGYHDSLSFLDLPIPFSCVAGNIVDGKGVVLDNGNLPLAMRASMAIPGVFAPVRKDGMVLVDGGISNNFPTDVAQKMGADIIIGVDVQAGMKGEDELTSIVGIIDQMTTIMGLTKYNENRKLADLYIKPDITPYSAASFTTTAIDTLIQRGEDMARSQWDEILKLKEKIGISQDEDAWQPVENKFLKNDTLPIREIYVTGVDSKDEKWLRKRIKLKENSLVSSDDLHNAIAVLYGTGSFVNVNYILNGDSIYDLTLSLKTKPSGSLNFGFRFDSEEMAAILLNTTISHKSLHGSRISLTGRLSMNPYAKLDYSFGNSFLRRAGLSYMFKYNNLSYYNKGKKTDDLEFSSHLVDLNVSDIYFKNFKFSTGIRYEYFDYESFLYAPETRSINVRPKGYFSYYGAAHLETLDKKYYPTKGLAFKAEYSLYTDRLFSNRVGSPFGALSADFSSAISLSKRVTILPSVYGRVLMGKNIPFPYLNTAGGTVPGRYMAQQMPFLGIRHLEVFDNSMLVAKLDLRVRLWKKHYISAKVNYAKQSMVFWDIAKGEDLIGGGIGYSYDSILGPIDVLFDLSNVDKKLGFYFNLGYYF